MYNKKWYKFSIMSDDFWTNRPIAHSGFDSKIILYTVL
jgi:hypothetical protein